MCSSFIFSLFGGFRVIFFPNFYRLILDCLRRECFPVSLNSHVSAETLEMHTIKCSYNFLNRRNPMHFLLVIFFFSFSLCDCRRPFKISFSHNTMDNKRSFNANQIDFLIYKNYKIIFFCPFWFRLRGQKKCSAISKIETSVCVVFNFAAVHSYTF